MRFPDNKLFQTILILSVAAFTLLACSNIGILDPTSTQTIHPNPTITRTFTPTFTASPTSTVTPSPSATPTQTLTPSITPTMSPLGVFQSKLLREGVEPSTYLHNNCEYLQKRWSRDGASIG